MRKVVLPLNKIFLDRINPRLEKLDKNQEDVEDDLQEYLFNEILESQKKKLIELVKSINDEGLNPLDNIAVLETKNDKYIVLEGNRRIAALRIINSPELMKKFKINKNELNNNYQIEVIVFQNREESNKWLLLRHTGENKGKGTVTWNTLQQKSFEEIAGRKVDKDILFVRLFKDISNLSSEIKDRIDYIHITSLRRLLGYSVIKESLNIDYNNKNWDLSNINLELADKLMYDLAVNKHFVEKFYSKDKAIQYIEEVSKKEIHNNIKKSLNKEYLNGQIEENAPKISSNLVTKYQSIDKENEKKSDLRKVRVQPSTNNRKVLIPTTFSLRINETKINNIFRELKRASLKEYISLVSCSFRVFLELSIDYYLIKVGKSKGNATLQSNFLLCLDELEKRKKISQDQKKQLQTTSSNDRSFISTKALNALMHTNLVIDENSLKTAWDNYQIFFEKVFEDTSEKNVTLNEKLL